MLNSNDLPLSWSRSNSTVPSFSTLPLLFGKMSWFSLGRLPHDFPVTTLFRQIHRRSRKGIVLRGCNNSLSVYLKSHGYQSVCVASEAVLSLTQADHFAKKSLKDLIRRGQRHGWVKEIPYTDENIRRINQLKADSRHGKKPQLKHLFINSFEPNTRCFVFSEGSGEWLAALSVSVVSPEKVQSELLIRHRDAPTGIMEALIYETFLILQKEGFRKWSLGEVPFINKRANIKSLKGFAVRQLGKWFRFAYDYESLYRFKNKFDPQWQYIYLCGKPSISFLTLSEIFIKSRFLSLVISAAFRSLLFSGKNQ